MKIQLLSFCLLSAFLFGVNIKANSQTLKFDKSSLTIKEPQGETDDKEESFDLILVAKDALTKVKIEAAKGSTHPKEKFTFQTVEKDLKKGKNSIPVKVKTASYSSDDTYICLKATYADSESETIQIEDTLFITNTVGVAGKLIKEYTTWDDSKRADIFIGTNFDFFGENVLTDWHGGARVFLPGITDLKFSDRVKDSYPRFGLYAGLYHSKSFSNFGNDTLLSEMQEYSRPLYGFPLTSPITGMPITYAVRQTDSVMTSTKNEMNNWGAYIAPMYQLSRFKTNSFITNLFVGIHGEVIRRNISTTYMFDTLASKIDTVIYSGRFFKSPPKAYKNVYYDSYLGISVPVQFLWKDIMELKVIPCVGYSPSDDRPQPTSKWFYFFQFDLLARLGGISLNLGGEVRGYFRNESSIFSAYIGTAFTIQKLADFISKK